jgi:hypothetical protein
MVGTISHGKAQCGPSQKSISKKIIHIPLILLSILIIGIGPVITRSHDLDISGTQQIDQGIEDWAVNPPKESILCAKPRENEREQCEALEAHILASVIRFEIFGPSDDDPAVLVYRVGHGTVINGRYLVVHNHFHLDVNAFEGAFAEDIFIDLYRADGQILLQNLHPPVFRVVREEPETMLWDFGSGESGEGFFESLGVTSASFKGPDQVQPKPGIEVAQVVWDGQSTGIEWVTIEEVNLDGEQPTIMLGNPLQLGASGGGVFWEGHHIANNWMRLRFVDANDQITREASLAALNTEWILNG